MADLQTRYPRPKDLSTIATAHKKCQTEQKKFPREKFCLSPPPRPRPRREPQLKINLSLCVSSVIALYALQRAVCGRFLLPCHHGFLVDALALRLHRLLGQGSRLCLLRSAETHRRPQYWRGVPRPELFRHSQCISLHLGPCDDRFQPAH